jgi:hypothetical protein
MKNWDRRERKTARSIRVAACIVAAGMTVAVTLALPRPAHAQGVTPPPVPDDIQVPSTSEAFLVGHAVGTQNYICLPSPTIGKVAWTLFTPQATLFDGGGEQVMTHYFSPNPQEGGLVRPAWEDSADTSTVWGRATGSSSDPSFVGPGAIPWLRIAIAGSQEGPTGGDALSETTFIHRVNTVGGAAPSTGCRLPTDIGKRAYVPYEADYFFYR